MVDFITQHAMQLGWGLFGVSELLALIPGVKSNSLFQLIFSLIKKGVGQ